MSAKYTLFVYLLKANNVEVFMLFMVEIIFLLK